MDLENEPLLIEPVPSIRYKLTCVYSENSNLSAHPNSRVNVLVFHPKERWIFGRLASVLKTIFHKCAISYHILVASLTLMAMF